MSDVVYPPVAVDLEIDRMVRNFDMQIRQMGLQGMEQYLEMSNQTIEEYRESMRENAEQSLQIELALVEFAQSEKLTVSDEEFEAHIGDMAGPLPEDADEEMTKSRIDMLDMMRAEHSRPHVESEILKDKSVKLLLAISRGEEIPEPVAEADAADDADQPDADDSDQPAQPAESEPAPEGAAADEANEEIAES